jgi:hypothetical protein
MAVTGNYYLNGPSLGSSTAVFTDVDLTVCAPDGFYSDGIISREQVNCILLPQQVCSNCTENVVTLEFNPTSALDLFCTTSLQVDAYMPLGETFLTTSQIFLTSSLTTPLTDGFYKEIGSNIYRENSGGNLQVQQPGPICPPTSQLYISGIAIPCNTFCTNNYNIVLQKSTVSGNDYFSLTIGDYIVGGLVDGWYAYYFETTNTNSNVSWRIFEITNDATGARVTDILQCDASNNCVNL